MSNSHKDTTFNTKLGTEAVVKRETLSAEGFQRANEILARVGAELLHPVPAATESVTYMGSAAVHIYQSEKLGQLFFVCQLDTLEGCPEVLASKAMSDLRGGVMERYGRKRQVLRSGF